MSEFIASIGTNCEVAFNIRNTFAIGQANPFDWWFTPVQAVAAILRDRFALDVTEGNLSHTTAPESVLNHKYGFLHHHDFARGEAERVLPQWRDQIPTVAAKYRFLADRFIAAGQRADTALLILNGDGAHRAYASPRVLDESVYAEIIAAAQDLFPRTRVTLAIFNGQSEPFDAALKAAEADPRILVAGPVMDYGDRMQGRLFAKSLLGWSEALIAVRNAASATRLDSAHLQMPIPSVVNLRRQYGPARRPAEDVLRSA
jgi:hypothetical protein